MTCWLALLSPTITVQKLADLEVTSGHPASLASREASRLRPLLDTATGLPLHTNSSDLPEKEEANRIGDKPSVSIVVPCRNESGHIHTFLDCLTLLDLDGLNAEVIIADGMSNDGTRGILERYCRMHRNTRVIDNPAGIVSTGLNRAIREARGEIIVRLDVHSEYAPSYVQTCVAVLQRTEAANVGGPARAIGSGLISRAIVAAYQSPFACGGARFHQEDFEGFVDTVPYGCWLKSTLENIGLFDEALVRNQDDELNLRLTRSGGNIFQSTAIISWYRPRSSLDALFRQYFQYGYWKVAVIKKSGSPAAWRHLVPGATVVTVGCLAAGGLAAWVAGLAALSIAIAATTLILATLYGLLALAAALSSALRHGWSIFPILPVVFLVYHISYGLGFVLGVIHYRRNPVELRASKLLSGISR